VAGQSALLGWLVLHRLVLLGQGSLELVLRLAPLLFGVGRSAVGGRPLERCVGIRPARRW
jgi:hypothetical protein